MRSLGVVSVDVAFAKFGLIGHPRFTTQGGIIPHTGTRGQPGVEASEAEGPHGLLGQSGQCAGARMVGLVAQDHLHIRIEGHHKVLSATASTDRAAEHGCSEPKNRSNRG